MGKRLLSANDASDFGKRQKPKKKRRKEQTMSDTGLCVMMIVITVGLVVNKIYVRSLEKRIDTLQSWVEYFLKIDLNVISKFVEEERSKHE